MKQTTEVIELYDLEDKIIAKVEINVDMPQTDPRSIMHLGRKFVEGGREGCFYGFGQFAEVPRDK